MYFLDELAGLVDALAAACLLAQRPALKMTVSGLLSSIYANEFYFVPDHRQGLLSGSYMENGR